MQTVLRAVQCAALTNEGGLDWGAPVLSHAWLCMLTQSRQRNDHAATLGGCSVGTSVHASITFKETRPGCCQLDVLQEGAGGVICSAALPSEGVWQAQPCVFFVKVRHTQVRNAPPCHSNAMITNCNIGKHMVSACSLKALCDIGRGQPALTR